MVAEALSWIGTPYHHAACVKGVGVDCAMILKAVYEAVGLVPSIAVDHYPHDWHLHRDAERYMAVVHAYAHEIDHEPQAGDIVLWKFGRCFSHGAIVVQWPTVVHAYLDTVVTLEDAGKAAWLNIIGENTAERGKPRPRKFFSYW